jgi:malonyl CoA-acyl carrier protein transacylase
MGKDVYEESSAARAVYDTASRVSGIDVAALSFEGPKETLDSTAFCQLAVLTHSIACLAAFNEATGGRWRPDIVGGHSLGEYSALVASGALAFEDAVALIVRRGRLMAEHGRGRMAAFPLDLDSIKPLADAHYCGVGGCNLPDRTVVGGSEDDLEALLAAARVQFGRQKGGRLLDAGAAFHTYLMMEAAHHFKPLLEALPLRPAEIRTLSNHTGGFHATDTEAIKAALFFQMFNPVKWMHNLDAAFKCGINAIIEFGGGCRTSFVEEGEAGMPQQGNLEGFTRKTLRNLGLEGIYLPAINAESIRSSQKRLQCYADLQRTADLPSAANMALDSGNDDKVWRLYLPLRRNLVGPEVMDVTAMLQDMGLEKTVSIMVESQDDSLQFIQQCVDASVAEAEPYLELCIGGCSASVIHYRNCEIEQQLASLSRQMGQATPVGF